MKLTIRRNQYSLKETGIIFNLYIKVNITGKEISLISHYDLKTKAIVFVDDIYLHSTTYTTNEETDRCYYSFGDLLEGRDIKSTQSAIVLNLEENIKSGLQKMKIIMEQTEAFGGEEVIEI